MLIDVAQRPARLRMFQWDGSNVDDLQAYIDNAGDSQGGVQVKTRDDGSAYIYWYNSEKPLVPGALVLAQGASWASPTVTVYTPTEANAALYPYPTLDLVLPDQSASTTTGTE